MKKKSWGLSHQGLQLTTHYDELQQNWPWQTLNHQLFQIAVVFHVKMYSSPRHLFHCPTATCYFFLFFWTACNTDYTFLPPDCSQSFLFVNYLELLKISTKGSILLGNYEGQRGQSRINHRGEIISAPRRDSCLALCIATVTMQGWRGSWRAASLINSMRW